MLLSAALTSGVIAAAVLLWNPMGDAVRWLGLAAFEPLARVLLLFAFLGAVEAALARLVPPGDRH